MHKCSVIGGFTVEAGSFLNRYLLVKETQLASRLPLHSLQWNLFNLSFNVIFPNYGKYIVFVFGRKLF